MDSPTYDGDIESSTTAGPDSQKTPLTPSHHYRNSPVSTVTSPIATPFSQTTSAQMQSQGPISPRLANSISPPIFISHPSNPSAPSRLVIDEPAPTAASQAAFNPASLTPNDIRAFVQKAIAGESSRKYRINHPPTDRQVRVYADGLLDALLLVLPPPYFSSCARGLRSFSFRVSSAWRKHVHECTEADDSDMPCS